MIIGIGCDIVDHATTKKLGWVSDNVKRQRILSPKEQAHLSNHPINFISGRFAAKEAVLKCLHIGMEDGIALTEIQILQLPSGQPYIELEGRAMVLAKSFGITRWHISISHSTNCSIAYVVAESA